MSKQLKLWNGRGIAISRKWDRASVYIAAYSREDARRVCEEATGHKPPVSELRDYFSQCWGNPMEGITPERGLWVQHNFGETPERVV